jgi:flagellin
MLTIKNNMMAANAARHLGTSYDTLSTSVERLSSGLRINSAKDDAAGLAVRELIRAEVAVLQQGSRNALDGISMLQSMEGAMGVIDDNLIRMKELAEQASTGSYSADQRTIMNAEFGEMADEIDRIANSTSFNSIAMLNSSSGDVSIHVGSTTTIDIDNVDMTKIGLGINTGVSGQSATFAQTLANTGTAAALTVAANDMMVRVAFSDTAGGTAEDVINVEFTDEGGTGGAYTLAQVVAAINVETQALGFDTDGTNKNYDMASVVTNADGTYSLGLAARGASDTVAISFGNATATEDATATGLLGAVSAALDDSYTALTDTTEYTGTTVAAGLNITTVASAVSALATLTTAINTKDTARASFGYKMNRLESTISNVNIAAENLMQAESRISDVDVATEMAKMTRTQVLAQAGISMLSQANSMPQMALSLLR